MRCFLLVVCFVGQGLCNLWPQGVVHYAINKKDYDVHSQDMIIETFVRLHNEICVKFFSTPANYTATEQHKILYISNPDKRKDCPPDRYDFSGNVVDMPIGYKCLDPKNIARIVVEMLRASIQQTALTINSYDLIKKFQERDETVPRPTLLTPSDRNYLNAFYHHECGSLSAPSRRSGDTGDYHNEEDDNAKMSRQNVEYYKKLVWPLGVVMYGVHPDIAPNDPSLNIIKHAMSTIELQSCVVFQPIPGSTEELEPKNFLWFSPGGEEEPHLGFLQGNQSLKLSVMSSRAPGHTAHALGVLLRALGVPMMSNRFDRNNYVSVHWNNVQPGKEHFLERSPKAAWLEQIPYDFTSATHAPANYMCRDCQPGSFTVLPLQDSLWQRTLSMGHRTDLSESDKKLLNLIYWKECQARFVNNRK